MNAEEQKAAEERRIFSAFLNCERAPRSRQDSIESRRPPEPDILCVLDDGSSVAFELVEIVEGDWAQLVGNQIRLQKSLDVAHEHRGQPLAAKFSDGLLYIRYQPTARLRERETVTPDLFEFLNALPDGVKGDVQPTGALASVVRSVGISRGNFGPGPFFQVEAAASIGDPTAERIEAKWAKRYDTEHPIELLAYYHLHPPIPEEFWIRRVRDFVESNWSTSPFRRVWVCDPGSQRILFSCARDS